MANLSKIKRERMLAHLATIREQYKTDDEMVTIPDYYFSFELKETGESW